MVNFSRNRGLGYAKRPDLVKDEAVPGPGNYEVSRSIGYKSALGKISTVTTKGNMNIKSEPPGPGAYNVSNDLASNSKTIDFFSSNR